jgi:hypothetical protein
MNYSTSPFEKLFSRVLTNPYIMTLLKVTLILYASQIAPKLPSPVIAYFDNTFFKIIALILIGYISSKDIQLAIILSVIFVLGINVLSGRHALESFSVYNSEYQKYGNQTLVEPESNIAPGCHDITIAELVALFDNDALRLQDLINTSIKELLRNVSSKKDKNSLMKIAKIVGLPQNLKLNDETAPYLATILTGFGVIVSGKCKPPQQ